MKPVFIGGAPRSGTTLMADMVGRIPQTLVTPESQFKFEVDLYRGVGRRRTPAEVGWFDSVRSHWRFHLWGLHLNEVDCGELLQMKSLPQVVQRLLCIYARQQGVTHATHWIDHTPRNVREGWSLIQHFPEARFIHMVRDGRAVVASMLKLDWVQASTVPRAVDYWLTETARSLVAERLLGDERVMRVRFEDLVSDPYATLERVAVFLQLRREAMRSASTLTLPSYTTVQHRLVGQPPDPSRAEGWRDELSPRHVEIIEAMAGDLICTLGYQPVYYPRARWMTRGERLGFTLKHFVAAPRKRWQRLIRRKRGLQAAAS